MKMLAYANSNGIPVWTVSKLAEFVKMRDEARFTRISWSDNKMSFRLHSSLKHSSALTVIVPLNHRDNKLSAIECNGEEVTYIVRSVKGYDYAFLVVEPGKDYYFRIAFDN